MRERTVRGLRRRFEVCLSAARAGEPSEGRRLDVTSTPAGHVDGRCLNSRLGCTVFCREQHWSGVAMHRAVARRHSRETGKVRRMSRCCPLRVFTVEADQVVRGRLDLPAAAARPRGVGGRCGDRRDPSRRASAVHTARICFSTEDNPRSRARSRRWSGTAATAASNADTKASYCSRSSGRFQVVALAFLVARCAKHDLRIDRIGVDRGNGVVEVEVLLTHELLQLFSALGA